MANGELEAQGSLADVPIAEKQEFVEFNPCLYHLEFGMRPRNVI